MTGRVLRIQRIGSVTRSGSADVFSPRVPVPRDGSFSFYTVAEVSAHDG